MPLTSALPTLKIELFLALEDARKSIPAGAEDGTAPTSINQTLADSMGQAIHDYTMQAVVSTSVVTVLAGIAAPLAPAGACAVAGAGMGTGTGVLL